MSIYREPTPPTEPPIATDAEIAAFRKELASTRGPRFTELYAALGALAFVGELIVLGSATEGSIPLPARVVLAACALIASVIVVKALRHERWLHRLGRAGLAPDRWNTSLGEIRRLHTEWSANVARSRVRPHRPAAAEETSLPIRDLGLAIDIDTSEFERGPSSVDTTREPKGEIFVPESDRPPRISA